MDSEFQYYKKGNTNYTSDGNVALKPSSSILKIELNGMCEITMVHPYDKEGRWKFLSMEDGVIKAPTPWSEGQLFVIYNTEKKITGIEVSAYHIFWDLNYSKILDRRAEVKNGQQALDILLSGTKYKGHSDITTINNCYWVDTNRIAAINGDKDNTFIKRWGGEIFLDNFDVTINDHIGGDYGSFISYGANMLDLGLKRNMTGIVTRCYPKAYNGYTLPEKYIDSPLINSYRIIKEGDLDCSELKLQEDCSEGETGYSTLNDLYDAMRKKVQDAYNNGLDKPTISGTCKVAALENTTKYKDVKGLVSIGLGDTVSVTHEDIGVNSQTRCVGYEWNQMTRKFEEVTLGELETTCFDSAADAANRINNILNNDGSVNALSISGIINAMQTKFKAMRDIAQTQHVRAMLFEDRVKGSKTYGAMCIGSMGFEIASERTPDDKDWNWRTFGSGQGFTADEIVAGILTAITIKNADGSFILDLSKSGGCDFYSNGNKALSIFSSAMRFYNFGKSTEELIGAIATTLRYNGDVLDPNKSFIELFHEPNSMMSLGYRDKTDGRIRSYMEFDTYGNGDNDCSISFFKDARFSNSILDMRGNRIYLNKYKYPNLYLSTSTTGWLWCNGSFVTTGGFECKGDKNCIQHTDKFGDIKFSSIEDIGAYLTWREYDAFKEECIYETKMSKYNKDGYYSCIVEIPDIIQQTIDTTGQYDVDINVIKSFANARLWTIGKEYFLVKSDKPCKFNFVLTGRRKGFETRSLEEQLIEAEKYKAKEKEKEKENKNMRVKARIRKYFKHNKRDFKLWEQCGEEWIANDGICDEG